MALFFISCGDNTETPLTDISTISINEPNVTIYSTDDTTDLTATVYYMDSTTADITKEVIWDSSDIEVADISGGLLLAGSSNGGDANITIEEIKGFAKFDALLPNYLYTFSWLRPERLKYLSKMLNDVRVFHVQIPWYMERLGEVHDVICEHSKDI